MKLINGRDASVLSLLARHPSLPEKDRSSLVPTLGKDARTVANAIVGAVKEKATRGKGKTRRAVKAKRESKKLSHGFAMRTAHALRDWADSNHRIAADSFQRGKTNRSTF